MTIRNIYGNEVKLNLDPPDEDYDDSEPTESAEESDGKWPFPRPQEPTDGSESLEPAPEDDEDDDPYCPQCDGSGEGRYEGSTCYSCGGSGLDRSGRDIS